MPGSRRGSEQPPFPFSLLNPSEIDGSAEPFGVGEAEIDLVLRQLLDEAFAWLRDPHARPVTGRAPDVRQLPPELSRLVGQASLLLRERPDPDLADGAESIHDLIGVHVGAVGDWIEKTRYSPHTAALFIQLAIEYFPGTPGLACRLGRVLRTLGMYEEAEAWLLYAAAAARGSGEPQQGEHEAMAFSCLGNLKRERGNFPEARRYHAKALRASRRHRLRKLEGDALYDLAVMAFERDDLVRGMSHARDAIAAYGPGHSQLLRLANDLAWIWMHLRGEGFRALQLFTAIEPHVHEPRFRVVLLANIARAMAHIDTDEVFEAAWLDAYAYLVRQQDEGGKAAALGQLALAALLARQLERTREVARQCRHLAESRGEHRMVFLAEQILDAVADGMPTLTEFQALFPGLVLEERATSSARQARDEEFAYDLGKAAVGARRDGAPESPMRALVSGR